MNFIDGLWRTTQSFSGSNPRFKISRFDNWNEAYPSQDYLISESGTYDITFDDRTKNIAITKRVNDDAGSTVEVTFECDNGFTQFGQSVYAIGNIDELGNWNLANAKILNPSDYPTWRKTIEIDKNQNVEWKCVKRSESNPNNNVQWEGGSNNSFVSSSNQTTQGSF